MVAWIDERDLFENSEISTEQDFSFIVCPNKGIRIIIAYNAELLYFFFLNFESKA